MRNSAFSIRCYDYHALVIDTHLPQECLTDEFLLSLDAIVLLQWNIKTEALLAHLLSRIWKRFHEADSPGSFSKSNSQLYKLCCLIIPRFRGNCTKHPLLLDDKVTQNERCSDVFHIAEELGINIIQISRSAHMTKNDSARTQNQAKYFQTQMENWFSYPRPTSADMKQKTRVIKRIQMFYKLGKGHLNLIPIFPSHAGCAYRFDALFVLESDTMSLNHSKTQLNSNQWLLYCVHSDPSNQTTGYPSESDSVKRLSSFYQQLVLHTGSVGSKPSPRRQSQVTPPKRNGLPQSHTFTAGFDRDRRKALRNVASLNVKIKSNLKLGPKSTSVETNDDNAPERMTVSCIEDLEGSHGGGGRLWLPSTCSMSMIEDRVQTEPEAERTLNVNRIQKDDDTDLSSVNLSNFSSGKLRSRTNTPVWKVPLQNETTPRTWTDPLDQIEAYSATVLLAIPEAGEADYYSDSPQYLTVADLRELGLYDDDDEDDESDADSVHSTEEARTKSSDPGLHYLCSNVVDMTKSDIIEATERMNLASFSPLTARRGLHFTASDELVSLVSSTTL